MKFGASHLKTISRSLYLKLISTLNMVCMTSPHDERTTLSSGNSSQKTFSSKLINFSDLNILSSVFPSFTFYLLKENMCRIWKLNYSETFSSNWFVSNLLNFSYIYMKIFEEFFTYTLKQSTKWKQNHQQTFQLWWKSHIYIKYLFPSVSTCTLFCISQYHLHMTYNPFQSHEDSFPMTCTCIP